MALQFSWDPDKASANERKHGVAFSEAVTAFSDPLSITVPDPYHSRTEERFVLVGTTDRSRLVVVAHTVRGERIRLISARTATRREQRAYEEES
jgi:uncharacterized DUF497 family protein